MKHALIPVLATILLAACSRTQDPLAELQQAGARTLSGQPLARQLPARPLLVNYWASWCAPCREEIPALNRLHQRYGQQIQFVGVALDQPAAIRTFMQRIPLNYPVITGDSLEIGKIMHSQGNTSKGIPYTALYDGEGRLLFSQQGPVSAAALAPELDKALGK
ncbi:TlpA family protein disulfide reductase [Chitinilyticum piscinae]|uniref:TlpA family protein disulfide reductase n=1 Tax=Chitinilyticum piscinae TaxID=2866724 RepID=A0A8J7G0U0_9NEIS|nr:TlpA disulfide reductase family protein [Chitinilyticum piscinae]MBE9609890.1 TlpA family protein disulfide reductase [Chitinilyticum piscinae]